MRILNKYKALYFWTMVLGVVFYLCMTNYEPDPKSVTVSANQPYELEVGNTFISNGETALFLVSTDNNFTLINSSDDIPVATGALKEPEQFETETEFYTQFVGQSGVAYESDQDLLIFAENPTNIQVKEYSVLLAIIGFLSLVFFVIFFIISGFLTLDAIFS